MLIAPLLSHRCVGIGTQQEALLFAPKSYHVEYSLLGWQRFSGLAAERSQALHTYAGSDDKTFNFSDFELEEYSQALWLDLLGRYFRSDIGRLTCY